MLEVSVAVISGFLLFFIFKEFKISYLEFCSCDAFIKQFSSFLKNLVFLLGFVRCHCCYQVDAPSCNFFAVFKTHSPDEFFSYLFPTVTERVFDLVPFFVNFPRRLIEVISVSTSKDLSVVLKASLVEGDSHWLFSWDLQQSPGFESKNRSWNPSFWSKLLVEKQLSCSFWP